MGGKDSALSSGRGNRDGGSAAPGMPRSGSAALFYRQFLPSQLSSSSAGDPIPSLEELSTLSRYLARVKSESTARLARLESRTSDDPLRPIFSGGPHDLFAPPGLTASASASADQRPSKHKTKERTFNLASPEPAPASPSTHASPSTANGAQRHRIKIKRERDGESVQSTAGPSSFESATVAKAKAGRGQSAIADDDESVATTDPDWDLDEDSLPSRPGRGRQKKRRRKDAGIDSLDEDSGSDFESAALAARGGPAAKNSTTALAASAAGARPGGLGGSASRRGSEVGAGAKPTGLGMRLKLNPAASKAAGSTNVSTVNSPAIHRKDEETTAMSTRRNSLLPTPSPMPSATPQPPQATMMPPAGPAPGWELPARTPQSFMPVLPASRLPRPYPTHPSEVNEDFANKDWKERERERDRQIERESAQPGTPGVGAGQSLVKEATTGRRGGRDQQQTPINTFYNYADAFFKTLTEDDLAWLSSKSDDNEPFQMPALGRHYKKVWEEEDALAASSSLDLYGTPFSGSGPGHSRTPSISVGGPSNGLPMDVSALGQDGPNGKGDSGIVDLDIAPPSRFKAKQMTDEHLGLGSQAAMDARNGPLAERLVSALLPKSSAADEGGMPGAAYDPSRSMSRAIGEDDDEDGEEDAEGEPDTALEGLLHDQDMVDFEERIRRELKALDVLGADEEVDWSKRADDEISTTLRMVQRALARQQKINGMRKARLFQIAVDRMAYQDYVICLNTVEKEIEAGWNKRLRQIKTSLGKRKKAGAGGGGGGGSGAAATATASQHDDGGSQQANGSGASQSLGLNGLGSAAGTPQPSQAAANYNGPVRPQLPEALTSAMERRAKLQFAFGQMFDEARHAWETPTESVYADLDLDGVE